MLTTVKALVHACRPEKAWKQEAEVREQDAHGHRLLKSRHEDSRPRWVLGAERPSFYPNSLLLLGRESCREGASRSGNILK